ncbi:CRISPR system precrRNA processing endoribonuclease RAMP protein Cas6 (plasmid) [Halarchaeum sp. CBA1220]|uniref:CRISPR system precrRNA processing endoribonuclease RAMP protein Cas6 n=1 Tax=Halarchaeum sp. CBA1220 TaxID=1853682 RepID=UPI000F3AA3CF|nr:CRISPR system precrRNA processing endoribonuclease RAMP protein Cas6 [Halarchaeum sp. CBA1220]QLC35540.1 CRISPR system precrRNA processing endoribonuclease RAMP protein Cas6 [Halarchaeum sp. CBA1220]
MRRVDLTLEPEGAFPVPTANGYQIYGAVLSALDDVDEDVSTRVHDSPIGSLTNSGLLGAFDGSHRDHHKRVIRDETYDLKLGVADPRDQEVFQALADAFVFSGDTLELADGDFRVRDFASTNTTHEELLNEASRIVKQNHDTFEIEVCFETPTCIKESGEITTMFPHRGSVFRSLLRKWSSTIPDERDDELDLAMTREDFETNLIEKPDAYTYETHSVLVNRGEDGGPILRQGFTADCTYRFKGASEAIRTAVTALALFSEYAGVGGFVSRGCGTVSVEVAA